MKAQNTVRIVDDVSFQVGKQSRDTLRYMQRELRDRFMARSEELVRSAQESLIAAEQALQAGEAERRQRIADLHAELERIAALEHEGQALALAVESAGLLAAVTNASNLSSTARRLLQRTIDVPGLGRTQAVAARGTRPDERPTWSPSPARSRQANRRCSTR